MIDLEDVATFEAAEVEWADAEQKTIDLVRIRGFAIACMKLAETSMAAVVRAEEALERARRVLEVETRRVNAACELAERMARFAERARAGDVEIETRREAADALEELVG